MKMFHCVPISARKVKNTIFIKNKITERSRYCKLDINKLEKLFKTEKTKQLTREKVKEKPMVKKKKNTC